MCIVFEKEQKDMFILESSVTSKIKVVSCFDIVQTVSVWKIWIQYNCQAERKLYEFSTGRLGHRSARLNAR